MENCVRSKLANCDGNQNSLNRVLNKEKIAKKMNSSMCEDYSILSVVQCRLLSYYFLTFVYSSSRQRR